MANKQSETLIKRNPNLCEINKEYPSLQYSPMDRHLCTSTTTKSLKIPQSIIIHKLSNTIPIDQHQKDSKNVRDEIEIIQLFQYQQEEEIKNKFYRKCRYQVTNSNDDEEEMEEKRDNTN